jgi:hypothetical protein
MSSLVGQYAVNSRVAVSERLVEQINAILLDGVTDPDRLAHLGRLGAQLVIQRAMEDEVAAFLGRARYAREPAARGWRNANPGRHVEVPNAELLASEAFLAQTLAAP